MACWCSSARQQLKHAFDQERVCQHTLVAAVFEHQQAAVEPSLVDQLRFAGSDQRIITGVRYQARQLELIAVDVKPGDLQADILLDLANKRRLRPRRHAQPLGKTAQYPEQLRRRGNAD